MSKIIMNAQQAILTFSQSDKVKAGIIWSSQALEAYIHMPEDEKTGSIKIIRIFINTIMHDIHIAQKVAQDSLWNEVARHMDMSIVMIDSGVPHEAAFHLGQALSQVTTIAQRCMVFLQEQGLL